MLGRIIPGRLPSTVADIKLLDQRIAFNKRQLTLLSQRVAQGLMSEQEAAYRRLYLQGENEQLEQTKRSRRYSTPSYRTPLDVFESTRRGGAAKKYARESNNDGMASLQDTLVMTTVDAVALFHRTGTPCRQKV